VTTKVDGGEGRACGGTGLTKNSFVVLLGFFPKGQCPPAMALGVIVVAHSCLMADNGAWPALKGQRRGPLVPFARAEVAGH
jgi:hypothetical protein